MRLLARQRPRFGSGRIHRLLALPGWAVNEIRVHRVWRREHSQVLWKQHRVRRFFARIVVGCPRHSVRHKNHGGSHEFLTDGTEDGLRLRLLVVIDEYT